MNQSLRISPVIINVQLSPGKQYTYSLSIDNPSRTPLPIRVTPDTFTTDEHGIDFSSQGSLNSLLPWITLQPQELIIPAQTKRIVQLSVKVPNTIPIGGYYGMLYIEPVSPQNNESSLVSAKIGVLLLANIGITEKKQSIELVESRFDSLLYNDGPVHHTLRLQNPSLNHLTVKPKLVVKPMFGTEKIYQYEDKIVFPGKARRWDEVIELPDYYHGFYQTKLIISTGNGSQHMYPGYIFAFPLLTLLSGVCIALAAFFIITKRGRVKKALHILFRIK